jgi:hypothetical protein
MRPGVCCPGSLARRGRLGQVGRLPKARIGGAGLPRWCTAAWRVLGRAARDRYDRCLLRAMNARPAAAVVKVLGKLACYSRYRVCILCAYIYECIELAVGPDFQRGVAARFLKPPFSVFSPPRKQAKPCRCILSTIDTTPSCC